MTETRSSQEIILHFNQLINSLILKVEKRSNTPKEKADVDRLRQRINLLRKMHSHGGQALLEEVGPILYKYTDQILSRSEDFFLNMDIQSKFGHKINKETEFVYSLVDNVKNIYKHSRQKEKDEIYSEIISLHTDYIGYCIVCGLDPLMPIA